MGTSERRTALMKLLCRRRYETITNLAVEFGVSERTIRRDISTLSISEPIYTQAGKYGGVYVMDNYYMDRMYFEEPASKVLQKLLEIAQKKEKCVLTASEIDTLEKLIEEHTKPPSIKIGGGFINGNF